MFPLLSTGDHSFLSHFMRRICGEWSFTTYYEESNIRYNSNICKTCSPHVPFRSEFWYRICLLVVVFCTIWDEDLSRSINALNRVENHIIFDETHHQYLKLGHYSSIIQPHPDILRRSRPSISSSDCCLVHGCTDTCVVVGRGEWGNLYSNNTGILWCA